MLVVDSMPYADSYKEQHLPMAVQLGYKNVYRYPGGVFAWKGAGYPLEKAE